MLCFNYTVGFSWSVAVLSRPLCVPSYKDRPLDAWQASPRQHFQRVSMHNIPHERPEPLFIPKLQSRFADFPYTRFLHTKGFLPRIPDAVISTVSICYESASFHGEYGYAHNRLPCCVTSMSSYLELGSSMNALSLDRYDDPIALVIPCEAVQCVAASRSICRDLNLLPFRLLRWLSPRA